MKKIQILGFALFAVFAFCAVTVASASATPEWLAKGAVILAASATTTKGEILLEDMNATGGKVDVICDGVFGGTAGPGAGGEINLVEGLEAKDVTKTNEATEFILCKLGTEKGACSGTEVEVKPLNLPWSLEVMLTAKWLRNADIYYILIKKGTGITGEPGYDVTCKTLIGNVTDECKGETGSEAINGTSGEVKSSFIDGTGLEGEEEITPAGECTLGGAKQALLSSIGAGIVTLNNGEALTVSE